MRKLWEQELLLDGMVKAKWNNVVLFLTMQFLQSCFSFLLNNFLLAFEQVLLLGFLFICLFVCLFACLFGFKFPYINHRISLCCLNYKIPSSWPADSEFLLQIID